MSVSGKEGEKVGRNNGMKGKGKGTHKGSLEVAIVVRDPLINKRRKFRHGIRKLLAGVQDRNLHAIMRAGPEKQEETERRERETAIADDVGGDDHSRLGRICQFGI